MTKRIPLVLFLAFNIFTSHGQEILGIPKNVLAKNKVYKCVEYISNDSLTNKKDPISARYVIFDTQGRKVEQDIQSDLEKSEVHYIYDHAGRESMRIFQPMSKVPKTGKETVRIYVYRYREIGQDIICCEYRPDEGTTKCDTLDQYYWRFDTLTDRSNRKTLISMKFRDKNMTDTLIRSFQYYNSNRLDSAKQYRYGDLTEIESVAYSYSLSNARVSEKSVTTRNNRLFISRTSYYLPSGLINYVEIKQNIYSSYSDTWTLDYLKKTFDYFYWK